MGKKINNKEVNGIDITQHIPYVHNIVKSFVNVYGIHDYYDDLVSDGIVGLIEAAKRFDHTKGNTFLTYAIYWIKLMIFKNLPKYISHITFNSLKVNIDREIKYNKLNTRNVIYLNQEVKEDDTRTTFEEIVITPDYNPDEIENKIFLEQIRDKLTKVFNEVLDERERIVIRNRIGLEDDKPKTLEEVGKMLNISRERVRQIENRALRKIRRKILNDKKFKDLRYVVNIT